MAVDERYPGHKAVIAYFRDVDSVDCTYPHFLEALRETILESPPFTEDWSGLDGVWYRGTRDWRKRREGASRLSVMSFTWNGSRGFCRCFRRPSDERKALRGCCYVAHFYIAQHRTARGVSAAASGASLRSPPTNSFLYS
ncbi:hypothetical protein BC936DRAFT_142837 [Jimgerdemannia flammicorona]|uniref:Uncharacterized protein n=1 Tax=Jimgerdemannia flammicorona TaxID=994334 RepID=A0A432ZZU0_9FUNG|nr:hypothetical protein BC936DRAFT_142837 [Jimgerdemannia flammicorona]